MSEESEKFLHDGKMGWFGNRPLPKNYVLTEDLCRLLLSSLAGYTIDRTDVTHDCSILAKYAVSGMMKSFEQGKKCGNNIVLTSQIMGDSDGFQIHGIFPSFEAAALHIVKDCELETESKNTLIDQWKADAVKHETTIDRNLLSEHWCASIQPLRDEQGV